MQGVPKGKVVLLPYDEHWAEEYELVKQQVLEILGGDVLAIHHIGSTAVPGLVAKPILDIAVVVRDISSINASGMVAAGYDDTGNRDVGGRRLFVMRRDGILSTHHIHCYPPEHDNLRHCLLFRDYLRSHPDAAVTYGQLKLSLCDQYVDDRTAYTDNKADFIESILQKAQQ